MDCGWTRENIALYLYDELTAEARQELEAHVSRCAGCAAEVAELRGVQEQMSRREMREVEANLLAAARIGLSEQLAEEPMERGWRGWPIWHWRQGWGNGPRLSPLGLGLRLSPLMAMVIFLVGFGGGLGAMYRVSGWMQGRPAAVVAVNGSVAGTNGGSGNETLAAWAANSTGIAAESSGGNRAQRESMTGSGAALRGWVRTAGEGGARSGGSAELDAGTDLSEAVHEIALRQSLLRTLHAEANPALRLRAEEALAPLAALDLQVRQALLEALGDENPGVRAGAVEALAPVAVDSKVHEALVKLAKQDSNEYIRALARRVLTLAGIE